MVEFTRKLPKAELNIAPASFPPTALVSMTADETGGGMHPTTCNLLKNNIICITKSSLSSIISPVHP